MVSAIEWEEDKLNWTARSSGQQGIYVLTYCDWPVIRWCFNITKSSVIWMFIGLLIFPEYFFCDFEILCRNLQGKLISHRRGQGSDQTQTLTQIQEILYLYL